MARPPLALTLATAFFLSVLSAAYVNTSLYEFVQTHLALPVLFKVRQALGHAPAIHPKLKIFAYDDTSLAKHGAADLSLTTWSRILKGISERRPKAIYIDKTF